MAKARNTLTFTCFDPFDTDIDLYDWHAMYSQMITHTDH